MGWFDEQIKQRKIADQELFEDSFVQVAGSVMGENYANSLKGARFVSRKAIDDILQYYHIKPVEIPETITDFEDQLEYALRPHGLMWRKVKLDDSWYRNGFGLLLSSDKQGNALVLYPDVVSGYYFIDPGTGRKVRIKRNNTDLLTPEAFCFYRPLPLKKLGVRDLVIYLLECLSPSDLARMGIIALLATLFSMFTPRLTRILTGPVMSSGSYSALISIAVFMICTSFVSQMISVIRSLATSQIDTKASIAVESAVMMRVLSLRPNFFKQYSSGELSSRSNSIKSLCNMILSGLLATGVTSLTSILYIGQIFAYTAELVVPSLIIIVLTVSLGVITSLMQLNISREEMKLSAEGSGLSYAILNGIQKIRLAGAEKRTFARWAGHYAREAKYAYDPPFFLKISPVLISSVGLFGNIILYYVAVKCGISPSDYFGFNVAYGMLMGAFSSMAQIILSFARMRPVLEMAEPILKEEPEISEGKLVLSSLHGNIEMNNVSFAYSENEPLIIDDLSLKIKVGEYVAIVGKTGCGKSTLIRLLLGFEKPGRGAIFYDGKDLESIDVKSLRRKIGTVMQDGDLFSGDIFTNIAIAAPDLSLDGAWEAAEMAGIAQDIRQMPMGMNTMITEGSNTISGGQKQRLMIARALAPKPKILIFDEATSALDNVTQKQIAEALDGLKCTRIVIAHRLSTIRNADRILVLEKGHIIEEGSYDELIEHEGFFAKLVERQRLNID